MGVVKYSTFYEAVYEYEDVVTLNDNVLRVVPYNGDNQRVLEESLSTTPKGYVDKFRDRFGNTIYHVKVMEPHTSFTIASKGVVEVEMRELEDCKLPCTEDDAFTSSSSLIDVEFFREVAKEALRGSETLDQLVRRTVEIVRERVKYKEGVTNVWTKAHESFTMGFGVCQDISQITIGILRSAGVPARYVMGLVNDNPRTTHAWVEVKARNGWVPIDPTRRKFYNLAYVKFAVGRDYKDVAPVVGTFVSRGRGWLSKLKVEVKRID